MAEQAIQRPELDLRSLQTQLGTEEGVVAVDLFLSGVGRDAEVHGLRFEVTQGDGHQRQIFCTCPEERVQHVLTILVSPEAKANELAKDLQQKYGPQWPIHELPAVVPAKPAVVPALKIPRPPKKKVAAKKSPRKLAAVPRKAVKLRRVVTKKTRPPAKLVKGQADRRVNQLASSRLKALSGKGLNRDLNRIYRFIRQHPALVRQLGLLERRDVLGPDILLLEAIRDGLRQEGLALKLHGRQVRVVFSD